MQTPLEALRDYLSHHHLDGFILPVNDEFMGEYVPDSAQRLRWLTGFSGSAGLAIVLKDQCAFFTDGRYTLQAEQEVDKAFSRHNSAQVSPESWLKQHTTRATNMGYDPKLHTLATMRRYEKMAPELRWHPLTLNPVDALWKDRPAAPASSVRMQPMDFAGEPVAEKCKRVAHEIAAKGADALMLTAPDSICWLLNMRGRDVPFTPFILCYAIVTREGKVMLYLDEERVSAHAEEQWGDHVMVKAPAALEMDIKAFRKQRVIYDSAASPVWFYQHIKAAGADIIEETDPCQLLKARKNMAELEGMRNAHIRDGLAVTKFLHWLDDAVARKEKLTELSVAEKLEQFRKASPLYLEPSFNTISGWKEHGAIVHYRATPESNATITTNSLLLIDSGGQYSDGTTDITRTIAIGEPTQSMREHYTRVLKGHITLAMAMFPEGTSGSQLDALARHALWQVGLDYDHGTGHGVGSHLSVHEGPQRISKRGGDTPLEVGMILSNEPGYYRTGEYGIRIESLVAVTDAERAGDKRFFIFETLTLAPFDERLIDKTLLTPEEAQWVQYYHQKVLAAHKEHLNAAEIAWLEKKLS